MSPRTTATPRAQRDDGRVSDNERGQIDRANADGRQPVVFVHGLWLLQNSWERWADLFEREGYVALTPDWPGDPATPEAANADPGPLAGTTIGEVARHHEAIIQKLDRKPVLIGHSFGGALVQILAAKAVSAATVAIDPAGLRGVLPLPFSALKAAWPALRNPLNRHRAVPLSFEQFAYSFANTLDETEARELYDRFVVPGPGMPLFQAAAENLNPWSELALDWRAPERGPLLILSGDSDHTVPASVARAAYDHQCANPGITEFGAIAGRGHSLTIDHGWQDVAAAALAFIRRFS
ncbi:alpha/beta fold hydrolase [Sphingomonas koreensis]|nr:alpha/beta fold hydrolase [Sphingomonas koreensis]